MRKFKSVVAVLLALSMILCFAACGKKSDQEKIQGKWTTEMDFTQYMKSIFEDVDLHESVIPEDQMSVYMVFEFKEEKCSMYFDNEKTVESIKSYIESFRGLLVEYLYGQYKDTDLSKEEINDQFKDLYDVTLDEFADMVVWSTMDAQQIADSIAAEGSAEGYYKIEDGKLYIAESLLTMDAAEYYSYSFDGDKLLIEGSSSETFFSSFEEAGVKFPLVFDKN